MTILLALLTSLSVSAATEKKLDFKPKTATAVPQAAESQELELPKAPPAVSADSKIKFSDSCSGTDTAAASRKHLPNDSSCAITPVSDAAKDSRSLPGRDRTTQSNTATTTVNFGN